MADAEDEGEASAEDEYDDEYPADYKSQLKAQALSVARQFYCSSIVMVFPVISAIHDSLQIYHPYLIITDHEISYEEEQNNTMKIYADLAIASIGGLILGGILLNLIGRKYTVLAVSLSHLIISSYSYLSGVQDVLPYRVTLAHSFINNFGSMAYFIYLAEIASPTFRAFFMGFTSAAGIILSGTAMQESKINYLLLYSAIAITLSVILALFVPETPFWLTVKGNPEKAEETFTWIRAGLDESEFNQMLTQAENIIENRGIMRHICSQTFAIGLIFSGFIVICGFDPCQLIEAVMHDFYFPPDKNMTYSDYNEASTIISEPILHQYSHFIYGQSIFLLFNFVIPRKVLFFLSYMFGVLIVVPIRLKLWSAETLKMFSSWCSFSPHIGITLLIQILPTEIYPTALREIGVASTIIFVIMNKYFNLLFHTRVRVGFPLESMNLTTIYTSFYISLVGIPFILIFMPETKNMNIYQLDELKLSLPVSSASESEGESTEEVYDESQT